MTTVKHSKNIEPEEPKQYLRSIKPRYVYAALAVMAIIVLGLFLIIPHNRTLAYPTGAQEDKDRKFIIAEYFLSSTTCTNDNRDHTARVQAFNKYFKINQYDNRAVIRGCNDNDKLLAKSTDGNDAWLPTDVNITLNTRQNPVWQKECLIDDITTADTIVRPENSSIDANNLSICHKLRTVSYISVSIHFNF